MRAVEGKFVLDLDGVCDDLGMVPRQRHPGVGQAPVLRLQLAGAQLPCPPPGLGQELQHQCKDTVDTLQHPNDLVST